MIRRLYRRCLESSWWLWHTYPSTENTEIGLSSCNRVSLLKNTLSDVMSLSLGVVGLPSVILCCIREQDLPILLHFHSRTYHLLALSVQTTSNTKREGQLRIQSRKEYNMYDCKQVACSSI